MLQLIPGGFLKAVAEDSTPVLGGDLDGGGHDISNVGIGTFASLVVDTDTLVVNAAGYVDRVGIGTAAPTHTAHIVSPDFEVVLFKRDTGGGGGGGTMVFENDAGDRWGFGAGSDATMVIIDGTTSRGVFKIEPGAPENSIRVNSDGKVGILIGAVNPTDTLDLKTGTIRAGRYRIGADRASYAYWNTASPSLPAGEAAALELGFAGTNLPSAFPTRICANTNAYLEVFGDDAVAPTFNFIGGKVGFGTNLPLAQVDINSDILRLRTAKTPASAGAAGNAGDICWDASYLYACVAANTWKRAAMATW